MVNISLYVGGKREAIEAAEAKTHVERFEKQADGNTVVKLDISCRSWSKESIDILLAFMKDHAKGVRYLDLADIIASKDTEEGLQITESIATAFLESNLLEVELSDNAMGPRGLTRVESLFKNSAMQRLYLYNCGLSYESMELLHGWVTADDGRIANTLSELILDRNMMGVDGAKEVGKFLPHCKKLTYFSYNGSRPKSEGTKYLCEGLAGLAKNCKPVLRRLDLEDCDFGADGTIESLCEALSKSNQLQHLNLNDAELGVEGLEKLAAAFTEASCYLTHLKIDANGELGTDGARVLADFLVSQTGSLVCLHAGINEFGDEGIPILLEPFSACRNVLEDLKLDQNEIEGEGTKALITASLPKLKSLNLEENDEMGKKHLIAKYGKIVNFGEDDDDMDEEEADEDMDSLVKQMAGATLKA